MKIGTRVHGEVGVFYADRAASGRVLNPVAPDCVHVLLDDGDKAVVPVSTLTVEPTVCETRGEHTWTEGACVECGATA